MNEGDKLYKKDTKGKIRVWWIEYDEEKYRTHSGIDGGKIVTSGWIYCEEKNTGKANRTSVKQQVKLEVSAEYEKKLNQGKYHKSLEDVERGAKFVEPMLAQKYNAKKDIDFPYYSNPKLDGIRCIASKDKLQTRNGKDIVSCGHIEKTLQRFFNRYPDVVLDGELYNNEYKHDFEKIVSLVRKTKLKDDDITEIKKMVEYHIYDVVSDKKYDARYSFIVEELSGISPSIKIIECNTVNNEEDIQNFLDKYLKAGYEGQMLRNVSYPYEHKRSKSLIKHKTFEDEEAKIVDVLEGQGNWAGYAKSLIVELEDGTQQQSGMRGNFEKNKKVLDIKDQLIGTEVTVRHQGKTKEGKMRFPIVVNFWYKERDM